MEGRRACTEGVTEEAVVNGWLLGPGDLVRCVSGLYALDPRVASSLTLLGGMCGSTEQGSMGPPVASEEPRTGGKRCMEQKPHHVALEFVAHVRVVTAALLGWEWGGVGWEHLRLRCSWGSCKVPTEGWK